ncbi:DUF1684 domain-containing protein [Terriglobus sp. ADX1]|uniref:DUF1684 domain-containing protein n=1 Tax=Terriglobus sp. ADX1 TaxID=2794063 RepID=UPI002FE6725B
MKRLFVVLGMALPALCSACLPAQALSAAKALSPAEREEIAHFRKAQSKLLTSPQSALGMVSLEKFAEGDTSIGSAATSKIRIDHLSSQIGLVRLHGEQIEFLPPPSGFPKDLTIGGKPATAGAVTFDADGTSPTFREGSVNFVLRHKFGFFLVARDMQAPALLAFRGLDWYAPNAHYRITAAWKPWPQPHTLRIANILGQVNEETSYGIAEFTQNGRTFQLEPTFVQRKDKPLFLVFRDTTSRTTTYEGGRFLDIAMPSNGLNKPGTVVLDFNQARNPLCAFSSHTSCPIPPQQNRLPIAISAGEKRYNGKHS